MLLVATVLDNAVQQDNIGGYIIELGASKDLSFLHYISVC